MNLRTGPGPGARKPVLCPIFRRIVVPTLTSIELTHVYGGSGCHSGHSGKSKSKSHSGHSGHSGRNKW